MTAWYPAGPEERKNHYSKQGARIFRGDYDPGFFLEHSIKDTGIAVQEAAAMGLSLPGLALVHQVYSLVKVQGQDRSGTQALILALKTSTASEHKTPAMVLDVSDKGRIRPLAYAATIGVKAL